SRATVIPLNGIPSILARSNDDVHSISAKAGISEEKFRKFNDMSADDKIVPNEFYYIKKKKGKAKIGFHVAKPDESLWEISQQYGIKLSKLAKRNRMSIIDELAPGRVLWMDKTRPASEPIAYHEIQSAQISKPKKYNTIPEKPESPSKTEEVSANEEDVPEIIVPVVDTKEERLRKVKIHTVAQGESLWGISRLYEVSMDDLLRWNELPDPDSISIGQNIQVKAPIEEASKNKTIGQHTVQAGETVYAISRKYGMTVDEVMELNGLSSFALEIGQTLKVYEGD
ncbi:MAG: LysM peptidoglycan-binding domain-containing protein, partial [Ekhidna sp.]|nr:LysM peptidoglycan-binding domain-containing protein [Ekhidna sp.]